MTADMLRGIAGGLSAVGSILLAFRVRGILVAMQHVAGMHETNIRSLAEGIENPNQHIVLGTNSTKWIKNAEATWMLFVGFLLLAAGGACQFVAGFFLS